MYALLAALTIVVLFAVSLIVMIQRGNRSGDQVPPRRRELNRQKKITLSAQTTLFEVRELLAYYRPLLDGDLVGLGMLADVQARIAEHDKRMMEVDQ